MVQPHIAYLERAGCAFNCTVQIYCFMPDHLHVLLVGMEDDSDMLAAMTRFKLLSGLWFDRKKLPGWQGGFHDHIVKGSRDWQNHAWYIAQNPVRAGLVAEPLAYPFTGAIGHDLQDVIWGWQ